MLVGTQMIAKGHDFPRVTLVGVISVDVGLGLADFRAAERTFQLLTQVAGRAGRGERMGEAIVQTLYPEHYSIQMACRQDYPVFFERELGYRRGMRYPPTVAMINVLIRGRSFEEAMHTATDIVRRLERGAERARFLVLGPAPAPLGRLRGEHRVQLFLKGTRRADMRTALKDVLAAMPDVPAAGVTVDIGPVECIVDLWPRDEVERLERRRREADDEHEEGNGSQPQARAIERDLLVNRARMAWPEGHQHHHCQHRPHQPGARHERQADEPGDGRERYQRALASEHGVRDVAAVELADGKKIQRRRQQAKPGRKTPLGAC